MPSDHRAKDRRVFKTRTGKRHPGFQTDTQGAIMLDTLGEETATYYQLEFTDIGDVLVCEFKDSSNTTKLGIHNILASSYYKTYSLEESIDALELYNSESKLFNIFTVDNQDTASRLKALYQTSLVHLQYFIKHNIKPVFLSEAFSIGWDSQYSVYLVLWKAPQGPTANGFTSRHRFPADWLDNCCGIFQGQVLRKQDSGYYLENILTGAITNIASLVAADRGVILDTAPSGNGCYRVIT